MVLSAITLNKQKDRINSCQYIACLNFQNETNNLLGYNKKNIVIKASLKYIVKNKVNFRIMYFYA